MKATLIEIEYLPTPNATGVVFETYRNMTVFQAIAKVKRWYNEATIYNVKAEY